MYTVAQKSEDELVVKQFDVNVKNVRCPLIMLVVVVAVLFVVVCVFFVLHKDL